MKLEIMLKMKKKNENISVLLEKFLFCKNISFTFRKRK